MASSVVLSVYMLIPTTKIPLMIPSWLHHMFAKPAVPGHRVTSANTLVAQLLLELQTVTAAHEAWKIHLDAWLAGASDRVLVAEEVCFDDRCEMGRWLHGSGRRHLGHVPLFRALVAQHQTVHIAAANLISLTQAGRLDDAKRMREGAYLGASRGVMQALDALGHGLRHHGLPSPPPT